MKMSKLKFLNYFILQWFFIRLTKHTERVVDESNITSYDLINDGSISSRGTGNIKNLQWWSLQGFIVPTSGWGNDFKYVGEGPKYFTLTDKKEIKNN